MHQYCVLFALPNVVILKNDKKQFKGDLVNLVHSLRVQEYSPRCNAGKSRWQDLEVAGHIEPTERRHEMMNISAQFSFSFSLEFSFSAQRMMPPKVDGSSYLNLINRTVPLRWYISSSWQVKVVTIVCLWNLDKFFFYYHALQLNLHTFYRKNIACIN